MDKIIDIDFDINFVEFFDDIYANEIDRANYIISKLRKNYENYSFRFTKLNDLQDVTEDLLKTNNNPFEYIISITSNLNSSIRKVFDFRKRNSKTIKIYPYIILDFNEYKV
jgi:hypothetical protein